MPGIIDDCLIFIDKIREHATKGEVFRLEEDATRLTFDIIGKVSLDLRLNTQRADNGMINAFRSQVQVFLLRCQFLASESADSTSSLCSSCPTKESKVPSSDTTHTGSISDGETTES